MATARPPNSRGHAMSWATSWTREYRVSSAATSAALACGVLSASTQVRKGGAAPHAGRSLAQRPGHVVGGRDAPGGQHGTVGSAEGEGEDRLGAHLVTAVSAPFATAGDDQVHARREGHLQVGRVAHLAGGAQARVTQPGHRLGDVAEGDRHESRTLLARERDDRVELGGQLRYPGHQTDAEGGASRPRERRLLRDPLGRGAPARPDHAQASGCGDGMREATSRDARHGGADDRVTDAEQVGESSHALIMRPSSRAS